MEKSKLNSLIKRSITALILVPLTVLVLYLGYPYVEIMTLAFGGMLAWEWASMVPSKKASVYAILYTLTLSTSVYIDSWLGFLIVLVGAMFVAWSKGKGEERRGLLLLGVPYIAIGLGSVVWLYDLVGFIVTLWFLIVVWCVDVGGYVVGCSVKGPKLAPKISPNKTWSGLFGGMLFSVAASLAFCHMLNVDQHSLFYGVLAAIIAVIAQIGDLIESAIKRSLGLKDSSNLIPGHGGVFDRIDGLIFAAPFVYVLFRYALWLM